MRESLASAFASGRPYFGPELVAGQGEPRRHAHMQAAVRFLAESGVSAPFILEIGSWAGGSAITFGRAIQRWCKAGLVVCVDPWEPYLDLARDSGQIYRAMDNATRTGEILRLFRHNVKASGLGRMVLPIRGKSADILPRFSSDSFDLVFIDGSHIHEDVAADIAASQSLVREGGILSGDDLEIQASSCEPGFLAKAAASRIDWTAHPSGRNFHPGVTLAVGESFGEVGCWDGFWAVQKTNGGWQRPDLPAAEDGWPDHLL